MRAGDEDDLSVLRSKYHDWCSARIADRFVELSPEEIYELAHAGAEVQGRKAATASASMDAGAFSLEDPGYTELVQRVTEALATSMALPSFDEWIESYRREPSRYDKEMLGFWRSA